MLRATILLARDSAGKAYRWRFWRDARPPAYWMLADHTGHVRTLETTWAESVHRIRVILSNHGLTAEVS